MIMSRLKKQSSFKKLALVTSLLLILSFLATACSSSHDQMQILGPLLQITIIVRRSKAGIRRQKIKIPDQVWGKEAIVIRAVRLARARKM